MAEKLSPKLGISINELMSEEAAAAAAAANRSAVWLLKKCDEDTILQEVNRTVDVSFCLNCFFVEYEDEEDADDADGLNSLKSLALFFGLLLKLLFLLLFLLVCKYSNSFV